MANISQTLLMHLRMSGDYSDDTQRRNGWLSADGMAASSAANRAYIAAQHRLTDGFVRSLGTGAEPGVVRHISGLFSGQADGATWADARALSQPHPCKHNPSLANVARAGLAATAAGLAPAVAVGIVSGAWIGTLSAVGLLFSQGPIGALIGGVGAGITTGLMVGFVITAAVGALGLVAACAIAKARSQNARDTSRMWEDISGAVALLPRGAATLWLAPQHLIAAACET